MQNKQEIHYLHLSGMGGGKEGWEKKRKKALALLYQPDPGEESAYSDWPRDCPRWAGSMSARRAAGHSPLILQQ